MNNRSAVNDEISESHSSYSSVQDQRWSEVFRFFVSAIIGALFTSLFLWASILATGWWLSGDLHYSGQDSALYFYKVLGAMIFVVPISFIVSGSSVVLSSKWRTILLGFLIALSAVVGLILKFNVQMSLEGWMNFVSVVTPPIICCELAPKFFSMHLSPG